VVVNDTGGPVLGLQALADHRRAQLIDGKHNRGLAAAQNLGIAWARSHSFTYVLFSDQDSVAAPGMVPALLHALTNAPQEARIAAVGPIFHDPRETAVSTFVRIGFPLNLKLCCQYPEQVLECDFLISSGTLVPLAVLDDVGAMDEGLFIDNIDLEWSFRARARGYVLRGVCAATMQHHLGDTRYRLPFNLGQVVVHGPPRLYYMMRNRILLYRMRHVPIVWKLQDFPRLLVKLLLFCVLVGPRGRNLRFMVRGIWDGLHGRRGKLPA
jgi:rhamnosyltransferase